MLILYLSDAHIAPMWRPHLCCLTAPGCCYCVASILYPCDRGVFIAWPPYWTYGTGLLLCDRHIVLMWPACFNCVTAILYVCARGVVIVWPPYCTYVTAVLGRCDRHIVLNLNVVLCFYEHHIVLNVAVVLCLYGCLLPSNLFTAALAAAASVALSLCEQYSDGGTAQVLGLQLLRRLVCQHATASSLTPFAPWLLPKALSVWRLVVAWFL